MSRQYILDIVYHKYKAGHPIWNIV